LPAKQKFGFAAKFGVFDPAGNPGNPTKQHEEGSAENVDTQNTSQNRQNAGK
jgi:hypothetical protein